MRKIYLVRHSIRDFEVKNEEAPLTKEGHDLARDLVQYFRGKGITAIYASPYRRVVQTLEPTAKDLGLPIIRIEDLCERSVGEWVNDFDQFAWKQWQDPHYKLTTGESLHEVRERVVPAFEKILHSNSSSIMIGGHGTALSVLLNHYTEGGFAYDEFKMMTMPDVYLLEIEGTELRSLERLLFFR
ncbi:histidine phosphatase family protein [Facklamia lactis]|uniref:histidine phosphatase family protein n=1 Tax=Facklamia lactis TaxID=2749967 RepID=UPI0018CFAAC2|nr:histidine phosphatase family protein [Facklamia lactis]